MNADGYRPGEYGTLTPNPEGEKEEKRKKSKRTVIALAGLAALLAVGGCCVGSGLVQKIVPQREEETVVVEPADDVYVAPTPTEYIVPLSPTPTEAVQEPADVREGWYGVYEGTVSGEASWQYRDGIETRGFEDFNLWLDIARWEDCGRVMADAVCNEERSWGISAACHGCDDGTSKHVIMLYLPEDINSEENLTVTEDRITISPTADYPYEAVIERVDGQLRGYLIIGWGNPEDFSIVDPTTEPSSWSLDDFTIEKTTHRVPCWGDVDYSQ